MVAACSDNAATTTTADDDGTTTTTSGSTTTTAAPGTTAAAEGDDLSNLLALYEMTPLRTTYAFSDAGEETIVTLSQDPTREPPVEAVIIEDSGAKLITTGDQSVFCDTEANQCFSVPDGPGAGFGAEMLGPFAGGLFLAADLADIPGAGVAESTETIAERTGLCFTFTPPAGAGFDSETVRQCIDTELGFTLLIQNQETGGELETVMELIDFGDPLPDDFTASGPVSATP